MRPTLLEIGILAALLVCVLGCETEGSSRSGAIDKAIEKVRSDSRVEEALGRPVEVLNTRSDLVVTAHPNGTIEEKFGFVVRGPKGEAEAQMTLSSRSHNDRYQLQELIVFCRGTNQRIVLVGAGSASGDATTSDRSPDIPETIGVILLMAAWVSAIIFGIRAARRKGVSPHWMWFGIHPLGAVIACAIIMLGVKVGTCPNCKGPVRRGSAFCPSCRTPVGMPIHGTGTSASPIPNAPPLPGTAVAPPFPPMLPVGDPIRPVTAKVRCLQCNRFCKASLAYCPSCSAPVPRIVCPSCGSARTRIAARNIVHIIISMLLWGMAIGILIWMDPAIRMGASGRMLGGREGVEISNELAQGTAIVLMILGTALFVLAFNRRTRRLLCSSCGSESKITHQLKLVMPDETTVTHFQGGTGPVDSAMAPAPAAPESGPLMAPQTSPPVPLPTSVQYSGPSPHQPRLPNSGFAVASLVLGISSIPLCLFFGIPSLICGVLAIVFARKARLAVEAGRASWSSVGMANTGKICGIIGMAAGAVALAVLIVSLLSYFLGTSNLYRL